jgi:hypothetical protein
MRATREINGRWVEAIPMRAPVDVRWACEHDWTPYVHPSGEASWVDYGCVRCGAMMEAGSWPEGGRWRVRSWIARRVFRRA